MFLSCYDLLYVLPLSPHVDINGHSSAIPYNIMPVGPVEIPHGAKANVSLSAATRCVEPACVIG